MPKEDPDRSSSNGLPLPAAAFLYSGATQTELSGRAHAFYAGILVLAKLCSSFSIFLLANFMNTKLSHTKPWVGNSRQLAIPPLYSFAPLIQIATFIQFGSGLIFIVILNVLKWNTLPKLAKEGWKDPNWRRLIFYSICSTLLLFLRLGGIQLCGPFRTVFVGTYYELTLTTIINVCLMRSRLKWHLYGMVLFSVGILLEYLLDDSHLDHIDEPWHRLTNVIGLSMLLFSAFFKYIFNGSSFTVNLAKASGGTVQMHSASTFVSGIILFIVSIHHLLAGGDLVFFHVLPVTFIVIFGFVVDFYVDEIVVKRMDGTIASRIGTTASFFSAFIFVLVLSQTGTASAPGLFSLLAFGIIYFATFCLTTGGDRTNFVYSTLSNSSLPHTFRSSDQIPRACTMPNLTNQNGTTQTIVMIA